MDHDAVVRQQMTERYLLNELDSATRNEFEEHFFDCTDCALDVHAASVFVEQSKIALAEKPELEVAAGEKVMSISPAGWPAGLRSWLRPMFTLPVMAVLLVVIGYQNMVTYPQLRQSMRTPQVLPWGSVSIGTWGSGAPVIATRPGEGFLLFVRIPPDRGYSSYIAELYNPDGKVEWSLAIPATEAQDQWPVQVPGADRPAGSYRLAVKGVTSTGERKQVGQASFELQIQK